MNFHLQPSKAAFGVLGIVGHAGCGHANSHLGFIQDDSGGLSTVMRMLEKATGTDLTIVSVSARTGLNGAFFEVRTASGGVSRAYARRGITKQELRLAQHCVGLKAICSQALAVDCFGRIVGQGAMEVPVALQTAIANASMDSVKKAMPEAFELVDEGLEGNCGKVLAGVIDIDGIPVSVMALSNATLGGIGPNEDIEGNVNLYGKKNLMSRFQLDSVPSFVIEGKVCASPFSETIAEPTFLIRAYPGEDNREVAKALVRAAAELGYPARYLPNLLQRSKTAMKDLARLQGENIVEIGHAIAKAKTAREKVLLAAQLNEFASQELGGITFMSNDVHEVMGGVGCIPGTSAVISLFISKAQLQEDVLPTLTVEETDKYCNMICMGTKYLSQNLEAACDELAQAKKRFNLS